MTVYAGIGGRKTPVYILELMTVLGEHFANQGYCLRSGNAVGADQAFHFGACKVPEHEAEIYLPWSSYNLDQCPDRKDTIAMVPLPDEAYRIAAQYHRAWGRLSDGSKALFARNTLIILGPTLDNPVDWVVCWTDNTTGGTAHALKLAKANDVRIFNLHEKKVFDGYMALYKQGRLQTTCVIS